MTRIGFSAPPIGLRFAGNSGKITQRPAHVSTESETTPAGKQNRRLFTSIATWLRGWLGQLGLARQNQSDANHPHCPAPAVQDEDDPYDAKLISILENEGGPIRQD